MRHIALAILLMNPSIAIAADADCSPYVDATIISSDGKFLGKLSNKYDSDSIFNKYGTHGSKYNSDSIWNRYGSYGSPYAKNSAFNPNTLDGPMIIKNRKVVAILTKNKNVRGAIDPTILSALCFDFTPD